MSLDRFPWSTTWDSRCCSRPRYVGRLAGRCRSMLGRAEVTDVPLQYHRERQRRPTASDGSSQASDGPAARPCSRPRAQGLRPRKHNAFRGHHLSDLRARGSRPSATRRTARSRSVTIPTSRSPSPTGSAPMSASHMIWQPAAQSFWIGDADLAFHYFRHPASPIPPLPARSGALLRGWRVCSAHCRSVRTTLEVPSTSAFRYLPCEPLLQFGQSRRICEAEQLLCRLQIGAHHTFYSGIDAALKILHPAPAAVGTCIRMRHCLAELCSVSLHLPIVCSNCPATS